MPYEIPQREPRNKEWNQLLNGKALIMELINSRILFSHRWELLVPCDDATEQFSSDDISFRLWEHFFVDLLTDGKRRATQKIELIIRLRPS